VEDVMTSSSDKNEYFNLPHEYNAMYFEGISQIRNIMKKESVLKGELLADFNFFNTYMWDEIFRPDFVKFVDEKHERKVNKRLYQLWIDLKEKY
jgi:hypothetical protein